MIGTSVSQNVMTPAFLWHHATRTAQLNAKKESPTTAMVNAYPLGFLVKMYADQVSSNLKNVL